MITANKVKTDNPSLWDSLRQPKVALMLLLGFSSGLPFMLVGNTLGYWLREVGLELTTIGFLSWVGIAYSMKFLWAPLVDKFDAPILGKLLGRRRGWIALTQLILMVCLVGVGFIAPHLKLLAFGSLILVAAFASATQDIVIDAFRIESARNNEELTVLTAASQLGYRAALLVADAIILIVAAGIGWAMSYQALGLLMLIGMFATWKMTEPLRTEIPVRVASENLMQRIYDGVVGPFIAFLKTHRQQAILILLMISLYRLPDFVMGPMANPLYADLGMHKDVVGSIRGSVGLVATLIGIASAGLIALRFGFIAALLAGAVLGPMSNLAFSWMAWSGPNLSVFACAMAIDNFSMGFAGASLVAYMSSLTSVGYTATQYALLTSFYALLGKVLKGFSGKIVDTLNLEMPLMDAYAWFFVGTALVGIPALLACLALAWKLRDKSR